MRQMIISLFPVLLLGFTQPVYQIMEDSTQEVCITIMNNIILEEGVDVRVMVSTDPTSKSLLLLRMCIYTLC